MTIESRLEAVITAAQLTSPGQVQTLANRAAETLEILLTSSEIPPTERIQIALRILELEPAVTAKANAIHASTNQVNPLDLSEAWKKWVVENKLLNVPDAVLVETMIREGIDAVTAHQAVGTLTADATYLQVNETNQRLRKLESMLAVKRQVAALAPTAKTIERRSNLSKADFLAEYYATNTPVILTDMMTDWPALTQWTPAYFKTHYGEVDVQVQCGRAADPDYEINLNQHRQTLKLKDYIDIVTQIGESNDYYMVANNGNLDREVFKPLFQDIQMPPFLNAADTHNRVFFWFGPAGTVTPLHHDPLNVMMAHIVGRKRWRLISPESTPLVYNDVGVFSRIDLENPDLERYPLFKEITVLEAVLEPGEIIFAPVGWWHQVKGLDLTLSLSFTNFDFPNQYTFHNPQINASS